MDQFSMSSQHQIWHYPLTIFSICALIGISLAISSQSFSQNPGSVAFNSYYVSASAAASGDGSQNRPFTSLQKAEAVSSNGDIIYLLPADGGDVLNGGIVLKPGQKLIGIDAEGNFAEDTEKRIKLTNTTSTLNGVMVQLADHNEVAGIHFMDMSNYAI